MTKRNMPFTPTLDLVALSYNSSNSKHPYSPVAKMETADGLDVGTVEITPKESPRVTDGGEQMVFLADVREIAAGVDGNKDRNIGKTAVISCNLGDRTGSADFSKLHIQAHVIKGLLDSASK